MGHFVVVEIAHDEAHRFLTRRQGQLLGIFRSRLHPRQFEAVSEHAQNVIVADGAFEWDDLGSWSALGRHLKPDPEGNCAVADFIHVDGARNIIYDARSKDRRTPIAVVGLRDSILVQTDDATLLAHKSQAQKVKELVRRLAEDPKLKKLV